MIKFTSCYVLLFFTFSSFAQIEVSDATAEEMIETLVGEGVVISNLVINCPEVSYGTFKGTSNMGIDEGIILTSGDAKLAEGPNNEEGAFLNNFSWVDDDDLQALIPNYDIMDACVIEFDFTPEGDSLSFKYVFGSEEYPEFLEGDFNDVFGFFVSGPGIDGEFSDGAVNLAVVPGTNLPVSIQTINNGPVKLEMDSTFTDGPCVNCEFFISNGNGDNFFNEPWFFDASFIQYNGFTTILTAGIKLTPGETYHMKLAISDAGDSTYDTGVFLEGKSFTTNPTLLTAEGIEGGVTYDNAVAGCVDGLFTFGFEEAFTCDVTVNFDVGGTAEAGTDYMSFAQSIDIPEGSLEESFEVQILDDGVAGDAKTIELYITGLSDNSCGNIDMDTISLTILDKPVFGINDELTIEEGQMAELEATGGFSYQWSGFDNPSQATQSVSPEETTDYSVTVSYGRCSENLSTRVNVTDMPPPPPTCELSVTSAEVDVCTGTFYTMKLAIDGATLGDNILVTDGDGNEAGSFTFNNDTTVDIGPILSTQTVLTITNVTNSACTPIELDTTAELEECLNPNAIPCSIAVTMGSIASCTRNAYDLMLMLTGTQKGESFTVTTMNGTNIGSYNYSDMPVLIADIPVDQTVLFIMDNEFTDCTTQTINIFPVVQACVNLVPLCTEIEAIPTVSDCTENDFTLSLMVNSNSTGNSFSVSDNLGNSLGVYSYDDVPVTIGPLSLEITSLTVSDSGNSECTTETGDLTAAVKECQDSLAMCSLTIASAEISSCTEENYSLLLDISGMDTGDSFSVSDASGNDLGTYNFADTLVEVIDITLSETVLTITDAADTDCSVSTDDLTAAIAACLKPPACSISSATATFVDCTETDYSVTLTVMGENVGASFSVSDASGNDLGTFNYNELVEISGIAISETVLTITDSDDAMCTMNTNDLTAEIQACLEPDVCNISAVMATFVNCTDVDYSIMLAVMSENPGTSFTVSDGSGNDLGTYNYADMPVEVTGIAVTESVLTVTDNDDATCSAMGNDLSAQINDCVNPPPPPPCSITTATAMLTSCTQNDYNAMLAVSGENTGATFNVSDASGNNLGTFNYGNPIELTNLATSVSIFTITDGSDATCTATSNDLATDIQNCIDGINNMNCSINAMAIMNTCTLNDYTLGLTVSGQNMGDSFTVTNASGANLGSYNYADSPIEIANVALTDHVFIITDNDDSSCFATTNNISVEIQACVDVITPPVGGCNISLSDISVVSCDDTSLSVQLTIAASNTAETFKAVTLDGLLVGNFAYPDGPIQIDNVSITQDYLYIIDNTDKSCFEFIYLVDLRNECLDPGACTLDVSAGLLSLDGDYICDGDAPAANLIDTTVPTGYNVFYVLHNNNNLSPSSLSNTQIYGLSNANFNLDNNLIPCGTPIYITAVIAEATNPTDIDLSANCTTFGNTVETTFLCPISILVEELCNKATGTFVLNVVVKGGLPAVQSASQFEISGDIYNGNAGNDELISITDLPDDTDYNIVATDPFGCTTSVSGNIICEKKLPVELITFTGKATENGNLLKWSTASEIQNDFFTIDHSSDGVNYTPLKVIDGSGTSNEAKSYEFLDRNAANGTTYYRLSQTDYDGSTTIEGVVFVTRGESIGVNIAGINPVPFIDELNVQLSSIENIFVRFSLTDLSGRLVLRNEYNLISGLTVVALDTEQFTPGLYLLRIETNTGSIVKKVIKH